MVERPYAPEEFRRELPKLEPSEKPKKGAEKIEWDTQSGPATLAKEETKVEQKTAPEFDFFLKAETLEQENTALKQTYQNLQQEANDLFTQLQRKYPRQKWDKNDPLYTEWRLARGQVMQMEKLLEVNQSLLKVNTKDRQEFEKAYARREEKWGIGQKAADQLAQDVRDDLEVFSAQKDSLMEILQNTELEKNLAHFWSQAKELIKNYFGAKKGKEKEMSEDKLIEFIRSLDEKTLWRLTAKFADTSLMEADAQKNKGLFGKLKNLFNPSGTADKEYNTWTKFLEDFHPLIGNKVPPRTGLRLEPAPTVKFKNL